MSRPLDEFAHPLKIYLSTKDKEGNSEWVRIRMPADLKQAGLRFLRENTTFLSSHQYFLNCLIRGMEYLEQNGMGELPPEVKAQLETDDLLARQQIKRSLVKNLHRLYFEASSQQERDCAKAKILMVASEQTDPELEAEILRIIR